MGREEVDEYDWDTEDLIPGDNDKPSDEEYYPNGPANLVSIPADQLPSSKDLGGDGT